MEMDRIVETERDPEGAARRLARHESEKSKLVALCGEEIGTAIAFILEAQRAVIRKSIFCWSVMEGDHEFHRQVLEGPATHWSRVRVEKLSLLVAQEERALAQFVEAFEALEEVPLWEEAGLEKDSR